MGPEEVNAEERLRVQLWDSDRTSADDDLGRIELDLKELMHSPQSKGKMWDRTDGFLALEGAYTRNKVPLSVSKVELRVMIGKRTKTLSSLADTVLPFKHLSH